MDKYAGKRAVSRLGVSGRGSSLTFRDAPNREDRSVQYCNRLGCSTRLNSMKSTEIGGSDRIKYSNPPFRSTSSKAIVGSSSKAYSAVTDLRKPHQESQYPCTHKKTVSPETNNMQLEKELSESSPSTSRIQTRPPEPENTESGVLKDLSVGTSEEMGSYSVTSNTRTQKQFHKRSGLDNNDSSLGSSNRRSFVPRNTSQAVKPASHGQGSNTSRYGLRNLGCASLDDVLPSGCSSSDSSRSKRAEVGKRRGPDREWSFARGKTLSGSSSGENLGSHRNSLSSPSVSLSERPSSQPASRRTRYWPPSRDGISSVRTRRTINGETRARLSEHENVNSVSLSEPPVVVPQLPQTEVSISGSTQSGSLQQSLAELPTIHQNSSRRLGSRNENVDRLFIQPEDGSARPFNGLSIDRDGFRSFSMDGIAEVLLALERIEQDEELTYEQFLALETNMFLGAFSFHDQHRDLRLDIDNMSYEELLALGEKMGTVSTALTEEELSNCLKKSCYVPAPPLVGNVACGDDDVKCSICQEEYVEGDEVGKLGCDHRYHVVCIHQWLQLKNWCPICKSHAIAS